MRLHLVQLHAPIRRLERDAGRKGSVREMVLARLLQALGKAGHELGDDLPDEGGFFPGNGEQHKNLQAAVRIRPCFRALEAQIGKFAGSEQPGRLRTARMPPPRSLQAHIRKVQIEQMADLPAAVWHIDRQFDIE